MPYVSKGPIYKNCSPSAGQQSALAADSDFRKTLTSSYNTDFNDAQGIFNELNGRLQGIVDAGPQQQGYSPQVLATMNAQATNNARAGAADTKFAASTKPTLSGSSEAIQKGAATQVNATADTTAGQNAENQQAEITQQSAQIGRQNYDAAVKEEGALPGATMDPVNNAGEAVTGAENVAGKQAGENAQTSSSWMGLAAGIAGAAVKGAEAGAGA
jgi:hypothetical protein